MVCCSKCPKVCPSFLVDQNLRIGGSTPFHQSSKPNTATDCTQAAIAFLLWAGERHICPVSRRNCEIPFLAFFILMQRCSFKVSWEPSHAPSHRVASLENGTSVSPVLILAEGGGPSA